MSKFNVVLVLALLWSPFATVRSETYTPGKTVRKDFKSFAKSFLDQHCTDCHGATDPEGNLSLVDLGPVDEINSAVWKSVWAQVTLKEMPPRDASDVGVIERLEFSDWIVSELKRVMRDKGGFRAHLDPDKGNFVDHELLFGKLPQGIKLVPTSSPARIWRVTPQEHMTRLNALINKEPDFNPEKPGLRTQGDVVPTNHPLFPKQQNHREDGVSRAGFHPRSVQPPFFLRLERMGSRIIPISIPSTVPKQLRFLG